MSIQKILLLALLVDLIAIAFLFKPVRKTMGLLFVILGAVACFKIIGLVLGIPMIIIGGLFLFIEIK